METVRRRLNIYGVLIFALVFFLGAVAPSSEAADPIPVTIATAFGPLANNATSHMFLANDYIQVPLDLDKAGYVEEEYFIGGTANVYQDDSSFNLSIVSTGPYRTRMIVRRPAKTNKFSGHVFVEWMNSARRWDQEIVFAYMYQYILRSGDIWIGVSSAPSVIDTYKILFDPVRYAALLWDYKLPATQSCANPAVESGLVFDIFRQLGALLKSDDPTNPLAGYDVKYLHLTGHGSQFVNTVNYSYELNAFGDGSPIYDGIFLKDGAGPTNFNQCMARIPTGDPRRKIREHNVPVIWSNPQTFIDPPNRIDDSDEPGYQYRLYEVAGAAHVDGWMHFFLPVDADQIKVNYIPPGRYDTWPFNYDCDPPLVTTATSNPLTKFSYPIIVAATVDNLKKWVEKGISPPMAERILVDANDDPILDEFDNAIGGVRSPGVDVPISSYYTSWTPSNVGSCWQMGVEVPFTEEQLKALYRSHGDYVMQVIRNTNQRVKEDWILREDGIEIIRKAVQANVP